MQIETPRPCPRDTGDYSVWVTKGYGDPRAVIHLAESGTLDLRDVHVEDCDRLIRAAAQAKEEILRYQAEMSAPHGRVHLYQGTCQLCGKPEGDALHAEAYRLACGCTDGGGCTCPGCQAGEIHEPGDAWHCDEHGKTSIAKPVSVPA